MTKNVNAQDRQKEIIFALLNGPKTIKDLDGWVTERLKLEEIISEPTRNRDLKELREKGYEITVEKQSDSNQPVYKLSNFELSFPFVQEDLCMLLELINLGFEMKLLKNKALLDKTKEYAGLIGTKKGQVRMDVFDKLTTLEHEDLKRIRTGINKRCAIEFIYNRPSDSKHVEIKGYPKEIVLMDKFLYLTVKVEKPIKWRDYRLDRILPLKNENHIVLHKRNIDPDPIDSKPKTYLKCRILPPLANFFEPQVWGLTHSKKEDSGSIIYSGYVAKPRFRVLKDALAFLPYIQILEDAELAKEFKEIIEKSYKLF